MSYPSRSESDVNNLSMNGCGNFFRVIHSCSHGFYPRRYALRTRGWKPARERFSQIAPNDLPKSLPCSHGFYPSCRCAKILTIPSMNDGLDKSLPYFILLMYHYPKLRFIVRHKRQTYQETIWCSQNDA